MKQTFRVMPKICSQGMRMTLLCGCIVLFALPIYAEKEITICTDVNFWAPFTFQELGESAGVHVEIVRQALDNLGYTVKMQPLPWERCKMMAERGRYDAIVSLSYKPDRAEYLYYPPDAATATESQWRITQAEYVIVVPIDSTYEWNGDDLMLPQPVRIPTGYAHVDRLKAKNMEVQTSQEYKNIFAMLVRDNNGSVIAVDFAAEMFLENKGYKDVLRIVSPPYESRTYFMGVSKKGKITQEEAQKIWDEIAKVREDRAIMEKIVTKVDAQIEKCLTEKLRCGLDWEE